MNELEAVTYETHPEPDAAIIWLHGLGADGHDFVPIIQQLELPDSAKIRFIFPHAPVRPVSINQGVEMRAWYDLYGLTAEAEEDQYGIKQMSQNIASLCDAQIDSGIAAERLILAGFSQGGAMTLHTGLRYPEKLAGILALSTYLCLPSSLANEISPHAQGLPVFMAHGLYDDVLPLELGEHSMQLITAQGVPVEWHSYPMPHSVSVEEIQDIRSWLLQRLN